MTASKAYIREPFVSCFEQRETTFAHCGIHAFLFTTANKTQYCVDPEAKWLKRRFQRLQKMFSTYAPLHQAHQCCSITARILVHPHLDGTLSCHLYIAYRNILY
ncbi:hypothetical protein ABVT39_008066 [Epinephelus coioides]